MQTKREHVRTTKTVKPVLVGDSGRERVISPGRMAYLKLVDSKKTIELQTLRGLIELGFELPRLNKLFIPLRPRNMSREEMEAAIIYLFEKNDLPNQHGTATHAGRRQHTETPGDGSGGGA